MPTRLDSRTVLLILAAFAGFAIINFGFEILAPSVDQWFGGRFGEGYSVWLGGLFFGCILVSVAWPFLGKKSEKGADGEPLEMTFSEANSRLLGDAKWQLENGKIAESLAFLSKIESKTLQNRVSAFRSRASLFDQNRTAGILSNDQIRLEQNQISHDILQVILALEKVEPERKLLDFSRRQEHLAAVPEKEWGEFRAELLRRFNQFYEDKIEERICLEMDLSYSQTGMSERHVERFFDGEAKTEAEVSGKLLAAFEKHRSLLIVGDAGAGKSTILYDLARTILRRDAGDPAQAVPVVLNLATWTDRSPRFWDWARQMLTESYGVGRPMAERLLLERRILPFLDGLDEIGRNEPKEKQAEMIRKCGQQIVDFVSEYDVPRLVICSRWEQFLAAEAHLPVKAEIEVKPLRLETVRKALETSLFSPKSGNADAAARNILAEFDRNDDLKAALLTPFYFKIAEQVFELRTADFALPEGQKAVEEWLTQQFIDKKIGQQDKYARRDVLRWLGWLAAMMNRQSAVRFELSLLQLFMLSNRKKYKIIFGLSLSFIFLIIGGLIVSFIEKDIVKGLFFGLFFGLGFCFLSIWIMDDFDEIEISNTKHSLILKSPYQQLKERLFIRILSYFIGALFVQFVLVYDATKDHKIQSIILSIFIGLWSFFYHSIYLHFVLRICLTIEDKTPFRLIPFLKYVEKKLRFLNKEDGGTWRFRHQILQDHFAKKWESGEWR